VTGHMTTKTTALVLNHLNLALDVASHALCFRFPLLWSYRCPRSTCSPGFRHTVLRMPIRRRYRRSLLRHVIRRGCFCLSVSLLFDFFLFLKAHFTPHSYALSHSSALNNGLCYYSTVDIHISLCIIRLNAFSFI
jgi:hypothetical protein